MAAGLSSIPLPGSPGHTPSIVVPSPVNRIKFGASLSTSGRYALQGSQALAGLRAWAVGTNADGGVRLPGRGSGVPATLSVYDDGSRPAQAAANVERLITHDDVDVLIGPYGSDLTRAVVPVARRHGKVLWNHGGAADDIHRGGSLIVGVFTPASRYLIGLVELIRGIDPEARHVAVLHRRQSPFGGQAAGGLRSVSGQGLRVDALAYSSAHEELAQISAQLRQSRPDIILAAGSFEDDCALARGLMANGVRTKAWGFVAAALQEFGRLLGTEAEGFFGPSQCEPDVERPVDLGPSNREVEQAIRRQGAAADYPALQAYAACLVAQHCVEKSSVADEDLWTTARSLECTTFFGRFSIGSTTGLQIGKDMVWMQWQNGKKHVVWPSAVAQAQPRYPWAWSVTAQASPGCN